MNPVEIGTGKSFKGLAAYLLHDPDRATTNDRVGWTQSFNLDDAGPETAWRLMAATAMSADELKAAAGVKKGKAAKNTAYHFALTFNPKDQPSEAVQRAAVTGALKALGLEKHQALAIAHRDTDHQHVHVMVNLIDPENGMSAASKQPDGGPSKLSNSQRKFSTWAHRFILDHGLTVTEGRLVNANKRAQGEQVDARRKPRNVYEREKEETTDRRRDFMKKKQANLAHDVALENEQMEDRHSNEWVALKGSYSTEKTALFESHKLISKAELDAMKDEQKKTWRTIYMLQRGELQDFERGEKTAIGRIWHAAAVFRDRALDGDSLGGFVAAFSQEERRNIVKRRHDQQSKKYAAQIRRDFEKRIADLNKDLGDKKAVARIRFMAACEALKREQGEDRAAMKKRWREYGAARKQALSRSQTQDYAGDRGRDYGRGRGLEPN